MAAREDERLTMALRPVSDPPQQDSVGETDPSELDEVAKLISEESHPGTPSGGPTYTMIERPRPGASAPEHTVAGWYPDDTDPTLMRYWDGHHLTGQTMRVDPATSGEAVPATAAGAQQSDDPERGARDRGTWTDLRPDGGSPTDATDRTRSAEAAVREVSTRSAPVVGAGDGPGAEAVVGAGAEADARPRPTPRPAPITRPTPARPVR